MSYVILIEGQFIDDADNLIWTISYDPRKASEKSKISTLIKGCQKEFAIENCKKVRISKPEEFRSHGEGLIRDPLETQTSHVETTQEITDDLGKFPPEAKILFDEIERTAEDHSISIEYKKTTSHISRKTTDTMTYGKTVWIFSTSIEPTNCQEWNRWEKSLPKKYDHISRIHSRRGFARALCSMVAAQSGALGKKTRMGHSFDGIDKFFTEHPSQLIIHGPVRYVKDPYEIISAASTGWEELLLPLFVKRMEFQDQREYRFVIHAEEEPAHEIVDLDASLALLGTMEQVNSLSNQGG